MTTIKDIANRLGVSISTVSKGLNGASDISEDLRQLVLDTAIEMGYKSKKMKNQELKKLCVFIENMEYTSKNQFGYDLILGFKQAAYRHNWEVTLLPATPELQKEEKYDTYMFKNGFSGAFIAGFTLQDPWMEQFHHTTIPTVLFDNYIPDNPNICYIGTPSTEGIRLAVNHLVQLGHRRIAFLNGSLHSMISEQRKQAYISTMVSHNLPVSDELTANGYYVAESAKYHVNNFLKAGATAILCGSDLIASGVITECQLRGYSVPEDVSVVGYDDLPISSLLSPPLTTIRQDRLELGKCAFSALDILIDHVPISHILLHPKLIIRDSTASCKMT
ncbi:MAG: LacI family DNA-binding transcriptional regulator [Roseburia sp.]